MYHNQEPVVFQHRGENTSEEPEKDLNTLDIPKNIYNNRKSNQKNQQHPSTPIKPQKQMQQPTGESILESNNITPPSNMTPQKQNSNLESEISEMKSLQQSLKLQNESLQSYIQNKTKNNAKIQKDLQTQYDDLKLEVKAKSEMINSLQKQLKENIIMNKANKAQDRQFQNKINELNQNQKNLEEKMSTEQEISAHYEKLYLQEKMKAEKLSQSNQNLEMTISVEKAKNITLEQQFKNDQAHSAIDIQENKKNINTLQTINKSLEDQLLQEILKNKQASS